MYMFSVENAFEVVKRIKIVSLQDQILRLLQLGDGNISRLTSSQPSLHLQSLLMHVQTFYLEVKSFTLQKMEINLVR